MTPSRGTRPRALRIPPDLWADAITKAQREGTTVTAVVIAALRAFVARTATPTDTPTRPDPPLVDLPEDFLDHGPRPRGQVGWRCIYCGKGRLFLGTVREEAAEAHAHQARCPLNPAARTATPTDTEETQP